MTGSITRQALRKHFFSLVRLYLFAGFVVATGMLYATLVAILPEWLRVQQAGRIMWDRELLGRVLYGSGCLLVPPVVFRWLIGRARSRSPARGPSSAAWMPAECRSSILRSPTRRVHVLIFVPLAAWAVVVTATAGSICFAARKPGDPLWPLGVVAAFALLSVALSVTAMYHAIAWFNPRVRIRLGCDALHPGDATDLSWDLSGRYERVDRLRVILEGHEDVIRRGSDGQTDVRRHVFTRKELANPTQTDEIRSGNVRLEVPVEAMHSLKTRHSAIAWSIRVHGEIPYHPDVNDTFPITLLPQPGRAASFSAGTAGHRTGEDDAIFISLDGGGSFAPGEVIDGEIRWDFEKPVAALELRLFWYTAGVEFPDVQIVEVQQFELPERHARRAFRFTLPDGPWSFSGSLVSLIWGLELVEMPFGKYQRLEFAVSPTGRTIDLGSLSVS